MNLKIKRMRELAGFFAQTVRTDGFGPTLKRSAAFLKRRFGSKKGRFLPKKETLAAQRALDYGALGWPAVSICVPLYNTPQKYLRQLLDSVLGQTCPNWQLCLADASDAAHGDVAQTVRAYQARDARIVYTKVENKGISANTNAAAALAAGRDVFSVPGSIFSPLCEGTNQLLREGAVPAVSGADILLWYGLAQPEQPEKAKPDGAPLSLDAQRMRDAMSAAAPLPLDALCAKTGLPPPKAMAALTELELAGFSRQLAGRQFQLK